MARIRDKKNSNSKKRNHHEQTNTPHNTLYYFNNNIKKENFTIFKIFFKTEKNYNNSNIRNHPFFVVCTLTTYRILGFQNRLSKRGKQ